jgi:hypothetical protein
MQKHSADLLVPLSQKAHTYIALVGSPKPLAYQECYSTHHTASIRRNHLNSGLLSLQTQVGFQHRHLLDAWNQLNRYLFHKVIPGKDVGVIVIVNGDGPCQGPWSDPGRRIVVAYKIVEKHGISLS